MQSPELQNKIATWQARISDGTITLEEMKEAVIYLRADRRRAAEAPTKARTTKARSADDLLSRLDVL